MEFSTQVDDTVKDIPNMYNSNYEMGKEFILFLHFSWHGKILILIILQKFICVHITPRAATENSIKKYKSKVNK